jgi:CheY-like chemotaxis protein
MDGLEATRRIRALPSPRASLPIVAMTASAFPSDIEACREAGMDDYLSKPVDRKKLAEVLSKFVPGARV